ncbi:MAG: hypothetical protein AB8G22_05020 [Saprospiraceae bacterium]
MPLLLILGLFFPRAIIVVLWFFTGWFSGALNNTLYLLLGLIFLPFSTLWYSVVINYFGGGWDTVSTVGMVVAVAIDLGIVGKSRR